jgi:tripartite-type tricarboxylate transporter receptor subunit TctC
MNRVFRRSDLTVAPAALAAVAAGALAAVFPAALAAVAPAALAGAVLPVLSAAFAKVALPILIAAFATLALPPAAALAQEATWPAGPVKVIVPYGPGSTPDVVARLVNEHLGRRLGHPFIVENKPGAGGNVGTAAVAKARPDGYTLGVTISGPLAANTLLYKNLPYDPAREIAPISILATQPSVIVANDQVSGDTMPKLLAALRKDPGRYNYSSMGPGSISHLAMQLVAVRSGTDIVHVAYRSSGDAVAALLTGEAQLACLPPAAVVGHIGGGRLRALAVTSEKRSALMPDVPTLSEAGVEDVQADAWMGMVAPAGTAPAILDKLQAEIVAILAMPEVVEQLRRVYMEPVGNSPQQMDAAIRADLKRWQPLIEKYRISLE